jgi:hypothetical protein
MHGKISHLVIHCRFPHVFLIETFPSLDLFISIEQRAETFVHTLHFSQNTSISLLLHTSLTENRCYSITIFSFDMHIRENSTTTMLLAVVVVANCEKLVCIRVSTMINNVNTSSISITLILTSQTLETNLCT